MDKPQPGMTRTLEDNIERLAARQRDTARQAKLSEKLSDAITAFAGSMAFVGIHLVLFGGWVAWNLWGSPKFDPSFVVLAMVASVEAIFLSTFVLISQNRMAAIADRRADLDLHINLLTEHELSQLAALVARMAEKLGVPTDAEDLREIEEDVSPERVLDAIEAATPVKG